MKLMAPAYGRATLIMGCGVQEKSEGCYIYDQYGRRFLDLFDAYGNQSFGYGHPRILAALRRQLDSGHTNSCKIFFEEGPVETRFYVDQGPSSENVGAIHDQSTGR